MILRRDLLKWAAGGLAVVGGAHQALANQAAPPTATPPAPKAPAPPTPPPAQPAPPTHPVAGPGVRLADPVPFDPNSVPDMARELAKHAFKPISNDLPDPFKSLNYDQYNGIALRDESRIWADQTVGFVIEPLHRGFEFPNAIQLNLVADDKSYRIIYDTSLFDFGKLGEPKKIGDIGFSGFRVLAPQSDHDLEDIASFQGANFFRAQADGQVAGLLARALALKIGDPRGEEMPVFKSLWIEKPSLVAATLVVHALVDSESVAGAFRFTVRPGEATIIDTECTLFPRVSIDDYGLATMSATHLLGFMDHKKFDDYRPMVSEVCGIQMLTGAEEWVWRPVANPSALQISSFQDNKPRGFGCLIRDRDFEDYVDPDNQWERRPSLWIEPLGDWSEGVVQLMEIPSQSDANDNILCFWRPKEALKAGGEVSFAYRQFWCWDPPQRPDLARAMHSRAGESGKHQRFFVEFVGDSLGDAELANKIDPTLTTGAGSITIKRLFADPDQKTCRVFFDLDPASADSAELRLVLTVDGKPVSETWLYRWTAV
jgi:glucans biosynthesis protein